MNANHIRGREKKTKKKQKSIKTMNYENFEKRRKKNLKFKINASPGIDSVCVFVL